MPMRCAASFATASTTGRCGCGARRPSPPARSPAAISSTSIAARELIWVIVAMGCHCGRRQPAAPAARRCAGEGPTETPAGKALLRDAGFWAVIVAAALIQGSHAAYYSFSAISWQAHGLGGLTIAGLWTLGVIAEIVVFALSPRFSLHPSSLMAIGGASAVVRWIVTAHDPPLALLAVVQLGHGLSFGLTILGTMTLLVQRVPSHQIARGQGYYAACSGLLGAATSIASGAIYAHIGEGVYYVMAAMARPGQPPDLVGAASAARLSPRARRPADRPGCRHNAARARGRAPAAAGRRDRRSAPAASPASRGPSTARLRPCSRS